MNKKVQKIAVWLMLFVMVGGFVAAILSYFR